jgi:hypothetical protein
MKRDFHSRIAAQSQGFMVADAVGREMTGGIKRLAGAHPASVGRGRLLGDITADGL